VRSWLRSPRADRRARDQHQQDRSSLLHRVVWPGALAGHVSGESGTEVSAGTAPKTHGCLRRSSRWSAGCILSASIGHRVANGAGRARVGALLVQHGRTSYSLADLGRALNEDARASTSG
jgi:hypothetical protein